MTKGMRETWRRIAAIVMGCMLFTGCGVTAEVDDYATNQGSYAKQSDNGEAQTDSQTEESTASTGCSIRDSWFGETPS